MTQSYTDPYTVLGLARTATATEIKQAYFALVRTYPPERDPEMFKRIRAAYESLRDPARRVETDMQLLDAWPEPARKRRPPQFNLKLQRADVIDATRALTDLERTDWREQYAKIKL